MHHQRTLAFEMAINSLACEMTAKRSPSLPMPAATGVFKARRHDSVPVSASNKTTRPLPVTKAKRPSVKLWLKGAWEVALMGPIWSDQALLMLNWDLKSVKAVGLGLSGVLEQATKPISKTPTVEKDSQVMLLAFIPTEKD
jgi:hypothetical protein